MGARCLAAVALAAVLGRGAAQASPAADAQALYDAGAYDQAYRLWSDLARKGDPRAAFGLGLLYDLGQDLPRDSGAAFRWYLRAAEGGLPAAEFNVAVMYDSGTVVPRNADLAALWYGRAAARGNPRAQYNLGQIYASGDGVARNPAQAAVWYRLAAVSGAQAATARLATLPKPQAVPPGAPAVLAAPVPYQLGPAAPPELARPGGPAGPPSPGPMGAGSAITPQDGHAMLELVWQAPPQPVPVRYYVEVAALDVALGEPRPRDVFTELVDRSATLVSLPPDPGRYAWRVYAVSDEQQSYASGPWLPFTIGGAH